MLMLFGPHEDYIVARFHSAAERELSYLVVVAQQKPSNNDIDEPLAHTTQAVLG